MKKPAFSASELSEFRMQYPHIKKGYTYLNHAAIGPISIPVKTAIDRFLEERHSGPIDNFEHVMKITADTRSRLSVYLNTSEGLTAIAEGFEWKTGDQVILNTMEFPATVQPFRAVENRGVEIRYAEPGNGQITAEILENLITPNTKMIVISSVQYLSGFKADLKSIGELCKANNIFFVVDAIQSLGAFQIDVQNCLIDALASGSHKWLMSPLGIGFLYLSESLSEKLRPFKTGWLSVKEPWELSNFEQNWQPISRHLEIGTPNMIGITGLGASLTFFSEIGSQKISNRINYLTDYIIQRLASIETVRIFSPTLSENRGGIVSFFESNVQEPEKQMEELKKKNVTISLREGLFRISPHFYNTEEEIDSIFDLIFSHS